MSDPSKGRTCRRGWPRRTGATPFGEVLRGSDGSYVLRLQALLTLRSRELDPLPLVEGAVAGGVDRGEVDEDVGAAVLLDESKALVGVEPFDRALSHVGLSFLTCRSRPGSASRVAP